MLPFADFPIQPVWVVFWAEHYIGAVQSQVVEIWGHKVICGVQGVELKAPTCPVDKGVEFMWQQHLFKC